MKIMATSLSKRCWPRNRSSLAMTQVDHWNSCSTRQTGLVTDPAPEALAAAFDHLLGKSRSQLACGARQAALITTVSILPGTTWSGNCSHEFNWFSPLPPARTGIADYRSASFRAQSNTNLRCGPIKPSWDSNLNSYARVRHYQPDRINWPRLNHADLTFLQHRQQSSLSRVDLAGQPRSIRDRDSSRSSRAQFLRQFVPGHGGTWTDTSRRWRLTTARRSTAATEFVNAEHADFDYMTEHYPLTLLALENCLGVVVHTEEALAQLEQAKRWPVIYAPLPSPVRLDRK